MVSGTTLVAVHLHGAVLSSSGLLHPAASTVESSVVR